ncbi:hypothetical protein Tco_0533553 [Tanacetum coccineum]
MSVRIGNDRQTGQFRNQRTITVVGNKETIGNQVGILLSAKQNEWLHDTDEEPDTQELDAYYVYMEKIQEVLNVDDDNSGPTYDAEPLEKVTIQTDDI